MKRLACVFGVATAAFLAWPAGAVAQPACVDCHDDIDPEVFVKTVHGGGDVDHLDKACRACHGTFEVTDDGHDTPAPVNCGMCHQDSAKVTAGSIHHAMREGETRGVGCADCHGTHDIVRVPEGTPGNGRRATAAMCAKCHKVAMEEYATGRHGMSDSATVATCVDCHGAHDVLDSKDPRSRAFRLNQAATCAACHLDTKRTDLPEGSQKAVSDYFSSVHGLAVEKSGLLVSATCVDCHGSHHIVGASDPESPLARANIPALCGRCHLGVEKQYRDSVHGEFFALGNTDVPVCTDCHQSHIIRTKWDPESSSYATNVPELCLKCHADQAMIARNGLTEMRAETYNRSYHGAASRLGDKTVANCASCHEAHDIRRSTDPKATTYPLNLHQTCGKCHRTKDPSEWMAVGKIHLTTADESHWVTHLVQNVYWVLISFAMAFFVGFILLDLWRHFRNR